MIEKFGSINFHRIPQCTFIHDEKCGNVGSFPGMRELDCSGQITEDAWSFYLDYRHKCVGDPKPSPPPSPKPKPPVPKPAPKPHSKPYSPPDDDKDDNSGGGDNYYSGEDGSFGDNSTPKKYVPPEEEGKRHHFRNFILVCIAGGVGYLVYE